MTILVVHTLIGMGSATSISLGPLCGHAVLSAGPNSPAPQRVRPALRGHRRAAARIAPVPATSAIVHLLEVAGGPLRVHPEHPMPVFPLLPPGEARWVEETETDVIVPVPVAGMDGIAALAVGRGFDGRVVREVDVPFFEAVGSMAGLAAERLRLLDAGEAAPEPPPARECPVCRSLAGAGEAPGCECGQAYVETDVPHLLARKFRLTRRLGTGGMGAVYLARDLRLDRDVAIKTLIGTSALRLMQLKAEAWAMATVAHPAVAQIHSVESWRGRPFGLGAAAQVDTLVVHWPGGETARYANLPAGREVHIVEGADVVETIMLENQPRP